MKERTILFSGPMVRAILEGRKTQTRRVVTNVDVANCCTHQCGGKSEAVLGRCPCGQPGDRLWVREGWRVAKHHDRTKPSELKPRSMTVHYEAGGHACNVLDGWTFFEEEPSGVEFGKWRPSIFMPRWASRITLEITGVRVERLNEISEADALMEGCEMDGEFPKEQPHPKCGMIGWDDPVEWYSWLWESINGPGSWDLNPWVWVVEFRRVLK